MMTPIISPTLVLCKKLPCPAKISIKLYMSKITALDIVRIKIQNSALGLFLLAMASLFLWYLNIQQYLVFYMLSRESF